MKDSLQPKRSEMVMLGLTNITDSSSVAPVAAAPAPVIAPVVKNTVAPDTPVIPTSLNVQTVEVQSNIDPLYQHIPTLQKDEIKTNNIDNEALKNDVCDRLQNILGLVDEKIDPAIPLRVYGLDSLTAMEVINWVQEEYKISIPQSQLLSDEVTTNEVINIISRSLLAKNDGTNFYSAPSNNTSMDFNDDISKSKPVSSIADSESTFDGSLVNQYDQTHENIIADDMLKKKNISIGIDKKSLEF